MAELSEGHRHKKSKNNPVILVADGNCTHSVCALASHINPSAWSDGHCPHAARSHSFVYISTS